MGGGSLRTPVVIFLWVFMLALSASGLEDFGEAGGAGEAAVENPCVFCCVFGFSALARGDRDVRMVGESVAWVKV